MARELTTLTDLARLGFADLDESSRLLDEVGEFHPLGELMPAFARAADPDQALRTLAELVRRRVLPPTPSLSARGVLRSE